MTPSQIQSLFLLKMIKLHIKPQNEDLRKVITLGTTTPNCFSVLYVRPWVQQNEDKEEWLCECISYSIAVPISVDGNLALKCYEHYNDDADATGLIFNLLDGKMKLSSKEKLMKITYTKNYESLLVQDLIPFIFWGNYHEKFLKEFNDIPCGFDTFSYSQRDEIMNELERKIMQYMDPPESALLDVQLQTMTRKTY